MIWHQKQLSEVFQNNWNGNAIKDCKGSLTHSQFNNQKLKMKPSNQGIRNFESINRAIRYTCNLQKGRPYLSEWEILPSSHKWYSCDQKNLERWRIFGYASLGAPSLSRHSTKTKMEDKIFTFMPSKMFTRKKECQVKCNLSFQKSFLLMLGFSQKVNLERLEGWSFEIYGWTVGA